MNQELRKIAAKITFPEFAGETALAVSGGADSMCLTLLASNHYGTVKPIVLIVDHKLRPESSLEASQTSDFLSKQGFKVVILNWDGNKPKSNIHQKARQARYKLMLDYCRNHKIKYLLTAHTKNDQAETVLMRIHRGSGVDGIAGIPNRKEIDGVEILRPMLKIFRTEVEDAVNCAKWPYVNDPSNNNLKYERTKIRNLLSSLEDKDIWFHRLSLLAENTARVREYLEEQTKICCNEVVDYSEFGFATLNAEALATYHEEIQFRVLVAILKRVSGHCYPPRFESLKRLKTSLESKDNSVTTLWGCRFKRKKDKIIIFREAAAIKSGVSTNCLWDNRYHINFKDAQVRRIDLTAWTILKKISKVELPFIEIVYTMPMIVNSIEEIIATPFYNNNGYIKLI